MAIEMFSTVPCTRKQLPARRRILRVQPTHHRQTLSSQCRSPLGQRYQAELCAHVHNEVQMFQVPYMDRLSDERGDLHWEKIVYIKILP
ncbi:hypothetical protein FKM82_026561 [Ascaphus truei]